MSVSDSKSNTFTVGKVDIKLIEEFDTNLSGEIESTTNTEVFNITNKIESLSAKMTEAMGPGQKVIKRPYIENTGDNDAWVYVTVGIPAAKSDQIYLDKTTGQFEIAGQEVTIPVQAYAIQNGYAGVTGVESVWNAYFSSSKQQQVFGTQLTDSADNVADRVTLFKILNNTNFDDVDPQNYNKPNRDWTQIGEVYQTTDYDYYVFAYNNLLEPGATTIAEGEDGYAFKGVTLSDAIGTEKPVTLQYIIKEKTEDTIGNDVDLSAEASVPEGYKLIRTEYYMPGDTVEKLYYDTSLAANGYSFSWKDYKNSSRKVCSGMIITEDTVLYALYKENSTQEPTEAPKPPSVYTNDWLTYTISYDKETNSLYAMLYGADLGHKNYPTTATEVEIPSFITVTKTGNTSLDYKILNGTFRSIDDTAASKMQVNQTYKIPVTRIEGDSNQTETTAFRKVVKKAYIGDNITYIGSLLADNNVLEEVQLPYNNPETYASFKNCTSLKTVTFPENFTTIGTDMFNGCTSLTSLEIPDGVITIGANAFADCTGLKTVTISDTVTTIKSNAFKNDRTITDFTVGKNVVTIGSGVSDGWGSAVIRYTGTLRDWCTKLNSAKIMEHNSALYVDNTLITGELEIPYGVTRIAEYAFYKCNTVTKVNIPSTVKTIETCTFNNSTKLAEVNFEDGIETIGQYAFASTALKTITIPESVQSLGSKAFYNISPLTEVTMLSNCNYAINDVFLREGVGDYYHLSRFNIGPAVTNANYPRAIDIAITADADNPVYSTKDGVLYNKDFSTLIYCPMLRSGEFVVDDTVTTISSAAFQARKNLTSIIIPDSVTSIGTGAFTNCAALKTVDIGKGVTSIGLEAFAGLTTLPKFTIDSENTAYAVEDGVLYDKAITKIVGYPGAKTEYIMPNTVTALDSSQFKATRIQKITFSSGLKTIPGQAFWNSTIQEVVIPSEITLIDAKAFGKCYSLRKVTMSPETISWNAFILCTSLTDVDFGNNLKTIGQEAFKNSAIKQANFPETLTSISAGAFANCNNLTKVVLPDSLTLIGGSAFGNCGSLTDITIGSGLRNLNGFSGCTALTTINIPGTVKTIDVTAFNSCTNLKTIVFNEGTTNISGFKGCTALTEINFPSTTTVISQNAFNGCTGLTSVTIPETVTSSGSQIFANCSNLETVTVNGNLSNYSDSFSNCPKLTTVSIGSSVKTIGSWFMSHPNITSINIAEGATSLVDNAFKDCSGLTSLTLPESISSIGNSAFANCTGLTSITIPDAVNNISEKMFSGCSSLTNITLPNHKLGTISANAFENCPNLTTLTLPDALTFADYAFGNTANLSTIKFNGTQARWNELINGRTFTIMGLHSGMVIQCTDGNITIAAG